MIHLSKLIYDYHTNNDFELHINETICNYINRKNINNLNPEIIETLEYLLNNYPNGSINTFISNNNTDIQVGIVLNNNNITIVFRGTDTVTDWMYNCDFAKRHIELSNIEIHKGFFDQLMSIYDELLNNINIIMNKIPNLNIYITGHSAGGAHATILAYLLKNIYKNKIIKLITFGSPKVGNLEWYNIFNNIENIIYYRITNEGDIVTQIPNINYYHVGINIHLLNNDIILNTNIDSDNDEVINNNISCFNNNLNCLNCSNYLNINNHKITSYYDNFKDKKNIFKLLFSHK
jgi:predicted lipase